MGSGARGSAHACHQEQIFDHHKIALIMHFTEPQNYKQHSSRYLRTRANSLVTRQWSSDESSHRIRLGQTQSWLLPGSSSGAGGGEGAWDRVKKTKNTYLPAATASPASSSWLLGRSRKHQGSHAPRSQSQRCSTALVGLSPVSGLEGWACSPCRLLCSLHGEQVKCTSLFWSA